MKKILTGFLLAALLAGTAAPVRAEDMVNEWKVQFMPEEKMESNFSSRDIEDAVSGLQPGDSVTFQVALENRHSATTNWYMTNKVLSSLEETVDNALAQNGGIQGGAYTYRLTYTDKNGNTTTLFDSDTVGGDETSGEGEEEREGLHEATGALEDYFFLDSLASGEGGAVSLLVALDGETQGNDYQDTLAKLQLNFAVELADSETEQTPRATTTPTATATATARATTTPAPANERAAVVRTGDDTNIIPYLIAMAVCGLAILFVARRNWKKIRKDGKGGDAK